MTSTQSTSASFKPSTAHTSTKTSSTCQQHIVIIVEFTRRRPVRVQWVLVEVGCVDVGADLGDDGRTEVAQPEALPVEPVEPPEKMRFVCIFYGKMPVGKFRG